MTTQEATTPAGARKLRKEILRQLGGRDWGEYEVKPGEYAVWVLTAATAGAAERTAVRLNALADLPGFFVAIYSEEDAVYTVEYQWAAEHHPNLLPKPTTDDVEVKTWFERDRSHIDLVDTRSDKTIVEWWDAEAQQMLEDGFFEAGPGLERSVVKYAQEMGWLQ